MRVLLDTNILVRACCRPQGIAGELLKRLIRPKHRLVLSNEILFETARVLRLPRMAKLHEGTDASIYEFITALYQAAEMVTVNPTLPGPIRDPKDSFVVRTAVAGRVQCLCTNDSDFFRPPAHDYLCTHKIEVLTDATLMRRLDA